MIMTIRQTMPYGGRVHQRSVDLARVESITPPRQNGDNEMQPGKLHLYSGKEVGYDADLHGIVLEKWSATHRTTTYTSGDVERLLEQRRAAEIVKAGQ